MSPTHRPGPLALTALALALASVGCQQKTGTETTIQATPRSVLAPNAPEDAKATTDADTPARTTTAAKPEPSPGTSEARGITLEPVTYSELLAKIAANKARYTLVDAWATWCGPCKENFPHVVQMHQKYGDKGLAVVSLSLDDPTKPKKVEEATQFLRDQKAVFTNYLLNEDADSGEGFEKLGVNAIPAVFVFGPDGKEVKRFTLDDPNHQFTYDDVEKTVVALLEGKKPADESAKP